MSQGHGHVTSLAQIAADVLQMPIENIDVVQGDTRQVQAGHGTFNSRSMPVGGSGVHVSSAAHRREGEEDRRRHDGGGRRGRVLLRRPVLRSRNRDRAADFAKVARMAYVGHVLPEGIEPGLDETLFYDPTGMGAPSGVHMAYVDVDPETGIVEILDYVAVDDAGTIINPLLATGKSTAASSKASARHSTKRSATIAETGQLLTGSLLDYAVPRPNMSPASDRSSRRRHPPPIRSA